MNYLILALIAITITVGMLVYYFRLYIFGFKVKVDYTVKIQDFIKEKGLKGLNLNSIADQIATIQPSEELYKPTTSQNTISGRFRKFGRISSENAIAKLNQDKERALLALEFLHVLAKYRFAKFPKIIVVLGSVWRRFYDARYVPVLLSFSGDR